MSQTLQPANNGTGGCLMLASCNFLFLCVAKDHRAMGAGYAVARGPKQSEIYRQNFFSFVMW